MTLGNPSPPTTFEGDLPPGIRPLPGPRPERSVWLGGPPADPAASPSEKSRVIGIDAARGLALIGMIATHVLPSSHSMTGEPTLQWSLFAGNAAALFALLAGISLTMMTGRTTPHTGRRWVRSAVSILIRALLLFSVFGLALNILPIPVYNILPYYALLFLLAIPLTLLRPLQLLVVTILFGVGGPVAIFLINRGLDYTVTSRPTFMDLTYDPSGVLLSLFSGGAFPVLTWMTFICLGLMLGRMGLERLSVQIQLAASGVVLMVASGALSGFLLNTGGGWQRIMEAIPAMTTQDAFNISVYGSQAGNVDPTTWWWLAVSGPHTNTPLSIGYSAGVAMFVLGGSLLVSRVWAEFLTPLLAAGSMTLTMYTAHLVFITFIDSGTLPLLWFAIQIGGALILATVWKMSVGRGPFEGFVARVSKWTAGLLVPVQDASAATGRHHLQP
ncbi:MAG: DUF1624 domain-containing protein [Propionibacterium sp.]|nr:DUF1624 domain-containing protein [Propionibacterium sp.]